MSLLAAWALLAAAQGQVGLRWPFGAGDVASPLRATYGQYEGDEEEDGDFHYGLDVIASKPGEPVYAIEAGTVRRVQLPGPDTGSDPACQDEVDAERAGLLVRSDSGRVLFYLHLHPDSIDEWKVGERVEEGTLLGQVIYQDTRTGVEHLHLSCIDGAYQKTCWHALEELSVANPLKLLRPGKVPDTTKPTFRNLKGYTKMFRFRTEEDEPQYPAVNTLDAGDVLDLVVRVQDEDGSGSKHLLAPYRIQMIVGSPGGNETREIVLDGKLPEELPGHAYSIDEKYHSLGQTKGKRYSYYFLPTNAGASGIDPGHQWRATSGHHDFVIRAFDAWDNAAELAFSLDIP